jgi:hypothetical protein
MASKNTRTWPAIERRRAVAAETRRDLDALNDIWRLLDGQEWDNDTLNDIAEVIRETGREIKEPE